MTHEAFEKSTTLRLMAAAFSDLADLLRKEIRLATAELTERARSTALAAALAVVAGLLLFIALLVAAAGIVLVIASAGLALFWSCFIVAGGFLVIAAVLGLVARSRAGLTPRRSMTQLSKDISLAKERAR